MAQGQHETRFNSSAGRPLVLADMRVCGVLQHDFAVVGTVQTYRNDETVNIEATLGLSFVHVGWFIDQVKGYANKHAGLPLRRVASTVADQVNATWAAKRDSLEGPLA